jgi:hypothetical protein
MEEEKKIEQNNNTQSEIKEAIDKELSSYINQESKNTTTEKIIPDNVIPNITEQKPKVISRPIIRTYRSDAEQTIKTGHISSINIAIAESNKILRNSQNKQEVESEKKKIAINKTFVIISLIFIFGGILSVGIPYLLVNKKDTIKTTSEKDISKSIITPDLVEKININDLNLNRVSTTLKERVDQSSTKLGQVKNIYLTDGQDITEQVISSTKFLSLIKANVPEEIERTIKPQYMFGMHNFDGNQRFLILKTGSYDLTFAGMLSWENDLWQDLKEIFSLKSDTESEQTTSVGIEIKKFQDAVFNNKDCRIVKNTAGEIVFLYSVVDKNTVVITTNVNTLREMISRLNKIAVTQ